MIPVFNLASFERGGRELVKCVFGETVGILDIFYKSKMDKTRKCVPRFLYIS